MARPIGTKRDSELIRSRLQDWLRAKTGVGDIEISRPTVPALGSSGEIYAFDVDWRQDRGAFPASIVVRVEPSDNAQLFLDTNFSEQCEVMDALGRFSDVPVPKILWFEGDHTILGSRFYVMEKLSGRAAHLGEPWLSQCSPTELRRLWWNGLQVMARIHRTDWRGLGLEFLRHPDRGQTILEEQLTDLQRYYEWVTREERYPIIELALDWLRCNEPPVNSNSITWGDARLGNQLFDEDLECRAVLDWELCGLANAESDLAWWLLVEKISMPQLTGLSPSFPERDETIECYQSWLGRRIGTLLYYDVLAAVKLGIIMVRAAALRTAAGVPSGPNVGLAEIVRLLD